MSNGARHGLGVLVGVVVTPIIAACLMYGANKLGMSVRTFRFEGGDRWLGAAVILVAAVLTGLLAGSRLSPVASLVPGVVYSLIGALWIVSPRWTFSNTGRDVLPSELDRGYLLLGPYGIFLLLGIALLVASVAPSRWKASSATGAGPRFGGTPPPAPMGPPPMHGAQPPMGAHQPHQPPQAPPGPGQSPPWQGAPQYGQPPAQQGTANPPPPPSGPPAAPAAPAPPADDRPESSPRGGSNDDNPGEWTQVYGGNRPQ
ncbi:hypothetical protein E1281_02890 [Actinomadura sp. KC345]|uniref:hypothetical protein n=1 Tax=Actinomadura sp. KC345 TaxID=2530371 RepID=UPI001042D859|nr:hypothetical protein [Actinomadura sp. KC345]TDC58002.1 hypothetical protein E1281_02890 [Actinomadura sp. KC345]